MKLSVTNIAWGDEYNEEMYDFLAENGFSGVEVAPSKVVPAPAYEHIDEAKVFAEKIKSEYGLEIPSMQSIWYGRKERIFGSDSEREFLLSYTERAADFAQAVSCGNLVFGCPANRRIEDNDEQAAIDFFKKIGAYCETKNTVFAIEANSVIYNTDYINTTAQAAELVERLDCAGIRLNYDFGAVIYNRERVEDIPLEPVNHIHISEPYLAPIEEREEHRTLAKIIAKSDYNSYVSVEMKDCGDIEKLKSILRYVKDVFS